jgi:hypothetical protein
MKKIFFFCIVIILTWHSYSQTYWQQEVNYQIEVKLNDVDHTLSAFETFEYLNNSPNNLDFIYIHIWPNAYRNKYTALAKQLYNNKEKVLFYGKEEDKGWIDSLDFKVDGLKVKWEYDTKFNDICKIILSKPLKSGEKIVVSTPFKVKIPSGEISRLGHIGQSYQITQWYPKPAVYDKNGWNQMPYLNQGEFYSEYGTFDVKITLPKNYVVGATGDLQTDSEKIFLEQKQESTKEFINNFNTNSDVNTKNKEDIKIRTKLNQVEKNSFPESSKEEKTIRFTQLNVHDFAWFADKRFEVLKGEVELPHSKRKVTTYAMFTPKNVKLWKNALEYINDGTFYYSLWNGDYPYNQVTAIDGTISAGGGMEYPNVTVIGNVGSAMSLETVIVHEVGHNWFYGILGTNERVHGWMDEGLNTLNEMRYVQTKYPNNKELSDAVLNGKFHLNDLNHHDMGDLGYRMMAIFGLDQAIETHSADFSPINYGVIMYQKTGLIFHYLKAILGDEKFDKAMQSYFETWKFKHPQPEDLKNVLEKNTGKDLAWLFTDLIQTTKHLDFKIKRVKQNQNGSEITFVNKGQIKAPLTYSIYTEKGNETFTTEAFDKKLKIQNSNQLITKVIIDKNKQIPEMYRSNNTWESSRMFKKIEPCKFEFLLGDHELGKNNHFWMPALGSNVADQFLLGLTFHNLGIPFKKFQYFVAPVYSFGRQNIAGIGEINFTLLPKNHIKVSRFGVSIKSFALETNRLKDSYFVGFSPYWFGKTDSKNKNTLETFFLQTIYRYDQNFINLNSSTITSLIPNNSNFTNHFGALFQHQFTYSQANYSIGTFLKSEYFDNLDNNDKVFKSSFEINTKIKYLRNKMNRFVEFRMFVGKIWNYKNKNYDGRNLDYSSSLGGARGNQDLFLEEYFFNRNSDPLNSAQRMENMGGFKTTSNFGTTNDFLSSINFYLQLPVKPDIFGLFVDYGMFNSYKVESVFNSGFAIRFKKIVCIYFPVLMSQNLENSYLSKDYLSRIRFSFRLNFVNIPLNVNSIF